MNIDEFKLWSVSFEIRYDDAYTIWDNIGRFWNTIKESWPNMELARNPSPVVTHFYIDNKFEIALETGKIYIIQHHNVDSELKEFTKLVDAIVSIAQEMFNISTYKRIGFRPVFFKEYDSKESTANGFLGLNLIRKVDTKHFNIEGKLSSLEYGSCWEDENSGARIKFASITRKVGIEIPINIPEIEKQTIEKWGIQIDMDYYTVKSVPKGQFRPSEWIKQARHIIRRDIKLYLEG